jgi:hypothetical protein
MGVKAARMMPAASSGIIAGKGLRSGSSCRFSAVPKGRELRAEVWVTGATDGGVRAVRDQHKPLWR